MALCAERCGTRQGAARRSSEQRFQIRRVRGECCWRKTLSSTARTPDGPDPCSAAASRREGPGRDTASTSRDDATMLRRARPSSRPRGSSAGATRPRRRPARAVDAAINAPRQSRHEGSPETQVRRRVVVKGLIAEPPASIRGRRSTPVPCGAPRRRPPHAPCRSSGPTNGVSAASRTQRP